MNDQIIKSFKIEKRVVEELDREGAKIGLGFSAYVRHILYNHINNLRVKRTMRNEYK